ncbi:Protein Wnt-4 [Halotydeus destructor]|nr:Protein Wnt-4 [Halotydeus destructor]
MFTGRPRELFPLNATSCHWLTTVIAILTLTSGVQCVKWLSMLKSSSLSDINSASLCDAMNGLSKKQIEFCRQNVDLMSAIQIGGEIAIKECQERFTNYRWNCSELDSSTVFGKMADSGTREAAFVHAITSAGVAYAVTKICSQGQLLKCGCDQSHLGPAIGFQWAGCSDNIAYGAAFAKSFVDSRYIKASRSTKSSGARARALMNIHNNNIGRKLLVNSMKIDCKCHGVSGSCEMKTCWRSMAPFAEIGHMLKVKFDSATQVQIHLPNGLNGTANLKPTTVGRNSRGNFSKRSRKGVLGAGHGKLSTENDLVYIRSSPDYCERDFKLGSFGTHGRHCNRTSIAPDSCDNLCCGRGFRTTYKSVRERCNCKFVWCCQVECDECWRTVEVNYCH